MALNKKDLIKLAKMAVNAKPASSYSFKGEEFSTNALNEALRAELNSLASTYALYRENRNTIFELIEETIQDALPVRVIEQYGQFAEIKQFNQGDRPVFTQRITTGSKRRAKQFVTRVGLAGIYEVFKLDGKSLEVPTSAVGGAAQIAFEEFLDGRVQMSDVLDIVLEGLDEQVYLEIEKALIASVEEMPHANQHTQKGFSEVAMDKLIAVADSYGKATIFCTYEFAAKMIPSDGWVSDEMRNQKWSNGYLGNYKGHNVVVLNQSFTDETNSVKVIEPGYAWIIPTGAEKPVKIAFEGQTVVRDIDNKDMSKEIQIYKKFGVAIFTKNNICVYKDEELTK